MKVTNRELQKRGLEMNKAKAGWAEGQCHRCGKLGWVKLLRVVRTSTSYFEYWFCVRCEVYERGK